MPIALRPARSLRGMGKRRDWQDWGQRFQVEMKTKGLDTKQLAVRVGRAYSTVRGWINGSREINLSDFFLLCSAAGINPAAILFTAGDAQFLALSRAWAHSDERGRELLLVAAEAAERISIEAPEQGVVRINPTRR
jgi:transcriptional regulator with XRE-family HTH domain